MAELTILEHCTHDSFYCMHDGFSASSPDPTAARSIRIYVYIFMACYRNRKIESFTHDDVDDLYMWKRFQEFGKSSRSPKSFNFYHHTSAARRKRLEPSGREGRVFGEVFQRAFREDGKLFMGKVSVGGNYCELCERFREYFKFSLEEFFGKNLHKLSTILFCTFFRCVFWALSWWWKNFFTFSAFLTYFSLCMLILRGNSDSNSKPNENDIPVRWNSTLNSVKIVVFFFLLILISSRFSVSIVHVRRKI